MKPKINDEHGQKENGLEFKTKGNPVPNGSVQWLIFL
jgi:hypothetical protein